MPYTTNLNLSFNSLNEDILIFLHNNREKMPNLRIVNLSNNKINERKAKAYTE